MRFITDDGKEFNTYTEALEHERKIGLSFQMFDFKGKLTQDFDQCAIVYLPLNDYEKKNGADKIQSAVDFIEFYEKLGSTKEEVGITEEDFGWFYWNEFDDRYEWISEDVASLFGTAFEAVRKNELRSAIEQ